MSEENVLKGFFYQDQYMIKNFSVYPELILMVLVVDGNGVSEIVALWFVNKEDGETIRDVVKFFMKHKPKAVDIKVVMVDKDMMKRDVIREELPGIQLHFLA